MSGFIDSQILRFDDDLQIEARTVLAHTAEPQNAFEVAVIMETLGHTDATARARGYSDLFDLARHLHESLDEFGAIAHPPADDGAVPDAPAPGGLRKGVGLFIGCSLPWLTAVGLLLATGTGFWSASVFTPDLASALVLALVVGLGSSALFTFPFGRRATFYLLQGNRSLLAWTARWFIGAGAIGCVAITGGVYLLLEQVLGAYTPGSTRAFFEMGVAIALLQLAFAPLYTLRAFGWLAGATAAGALVIVVGLSRVSHGPFTDPFDVVKVQLASLVTMIVVASAGCGWLLREEGRAVKVPSRWAVLRSTAPYGLYGAGYFLLVLVGQLVAGGAWQGSFHYSRGYSVVTGAALLVLLPLFGYTTVAGEHFPDEVDSYARRYSVEQVAEVSARAARIHWRRSGIVVVVGVATSGALIGLVAVLRPDLGAAAIAWAHLPLFAVTLVSYLALTVGVLSSQTLFMFSRPAVPTAAAVAGTALCLACGGLASLAWSDPTAAAVGLLVGTLAYAVATTRGAARALGDFDGSYYGAL